jgi:soluble lytic murein transglycosylase-like protein
MKKRHLFLMTPILSLFSSVAPYTPKTNLNITLKRDEINSVKYSLTSEHFENLRKQIPVSQASFEYLKQRTNAEREAFQKIPNKFKKIVEKIKREYDIPYDVIYNLVYKESSWRPYLKAGPNRNGTFDFGLGGINSDYIDYYRWRFYDKDFLKEFYRGEFNVVNPYVNLQISFRYLKHLVDYFEGDFDSAVKAYNAGSNKVKEDRIPDSTYKYSAFILRSF